jgi:phenylpropionate dioxygenase-like ring-hydroxylating dioxygenase large terminal subunit
VNEGDAVRPAAVRSDYVPKESYISADYVRLEKQRLWPKVWQIACREEELPRNGSFVTFEIAGESIIVVRTPEGIRAYYNVCQHRGRRLLEGEGQVAKIQCRFHGWRWSLDGRIEHVLDRDDWKGALCDDELHLKAPQVDTWGGFVWINMDPAAGTLRSYLAPAIDYLDPYDFGAMRYRWYKTFRLRCNWKVAMEAFNEGYHVAATHPQLLPYYDDVNTSVAHGKHAMFHYREARPMGQPSARLNRPLLDDTREAVHKYVTMMDRELNAIVSDRMGQVSSRLVSELQPGTKDFDTLAALMQFTYEAATATGAGWPAISAEQVMAAGTDWHLFPNAITLMFPDAAIWYRARPSGDDPNACLFDVWSLQRYAPGAEPKLRREFYQDWRSCETLGQVLEQDFGNMEQVQAGMHSRGFTAARPNPKQEIAVSNYHRVLHEYLGSGGEDR